MKKLIAMLAAPVHERIEEAVKRVAQYTADAQYHRLMHDYYSSEKGKLCPSVSVQKAYEFARLFEKQQEHFEEEELARRQTRDAQARLDALRKVKQ